MKLFMILYLAGEIIGSSVALPYGEEECRRRALVVEYALRADPEFKSINLRCEWR